MSRIPINPLVDFAFKKLLGDPANADILIDFLNAILKLVPPIAQVEIRNPFNPKEFDTDKLTVVDVKALDAHSRVFQVEVQLQVHAALPARALYTWARTYAEQLSNGQGYETLRPTFSIWIVNGLLFPESDQVHHRFRLQDPDAALLLTDQIELHMLQLPRFTPPRALDEEARWVYFLKEARNWTELPASLRFPALEKAMRQLDTISESTTDLERYRAREDFLREQATLEYFRQQTQRQYEQAQVDLEQAERALEEVRRAREQAEREREQAEREREQAEREREQAERALHAAQEQAAHAQSDSARLRELLRAAGLDPEV